MGGRAREHRRQFPAGCLSRSAVDGGCAIAHAYTNRNCSSQPNSYSHGYSDCGSERNADSYSYSHSNGYSHTYSYAVCCP